MTFQEFVAAHGLSIRHIKTGSWGRARIGTERQENASYFFAGDYGFVMNWKDGSDSVKVWKEDRPMSVPDIAEQNRRILESKLKYKREREVAHHQAAINAVEILRTCKLELHPYLAKKGFPEAVGHTYISDFSPVLVIPMSYRKNICGLQTITVGGEKRFLRGQRTSMAHYTIGSTGRTFLVEGYASALSLRSILVALSMMQHTVVCAFSANNLLKLAGEHPDGFVVADNDVSGTGQRIAEQSGLRWWMPDVVGQDINDLHKTAGLFKASQIFQMALKR